MGPGKTLGLRAKWVPRGGELGFEREGSGSRVPLDGPCA